MYRLIVHSAIIMKKFVLTALAVCMTSGLFAQKVKQDGYTNFKDTVFAMKDLVVEAEQVKKTQALKLDVPTKFVPQSTHVLPATLLEERGIQDIQDAVRFIPGIRIQTTYGAFQQLSIRGFDHSIVMVDGVRDERSGIDNSYPFGDLSNVESIELIKGPSSVLCGQGAVGGVLNITRKAPSDKTTVNAKMSVGSWDYRQSFLGIGGKLAGPFNYYASINYSNTDGWRDNMVKRLSVYGAISGKLSPKDEIEIRGGFNNDDYGTETGLAPYMSNDIYNLDGSLYLNKYDLQPGLSKKSRYNCCSDFMTNNAWNISAQYTHTFNKYIKVMDKFSYQYDDIDYFNTESLDYLTSSTQQDGYDHYYVSNDQITYICLDSVQRTYPLRFSHIAQSYNNQLEISGKFETGPIKHNYVAGWSMFFLRRVSYTGYNFGYDSNGDLIDGSDLWGPGLYSVSSVSEPTCGGTVYSKFSKANLHRRYMHGFYIQDLIEFSDQWKVLLSGRYDKYKYRKATTTANDGKRDYDEPDGSSFSGVKTNAFTYRVGVVYLPIPSLSLYASAGSYFKPINTTYSATTIYVNSNGNVFDPSENGGEVFKPQKGTQFEFGVRYELGNKLAANASVFYIDKKNVVTSLGTETIDGVRYTISGQVGRMDSKGFDIDVTYTPMPGLMFTTGYAFTNSKIREMASNPYMDSDATKGRQYAYIPRNTFYVLGDYIVTKGVLKNLGFNLSVNFQDDLYMNSSNTLKIDDYWMTDLGVSYKLKNNVRLALNVKNLFNVDYYSSVTPNFVPGAPRNYLVSASYSF